MKTVSMLVPILLSCVTCIRGEDGIPPVTGGFQQITWKSNLVSDPADLSQSKRKLLPLVQFALKAGPSELEFFAAGGGAAAMALGLPQEKAESLAGELSDYSKSLSKNPSFAKAPTALEYCYSDSKPDRGLATVYLPKDVDRKTTRVVFLHGYGGSVLPLLAPIVQAFPESIVIAPAFGVSGGGISSGYVDEAIQSAREIEDLASLRFEQPPLLVGLSAGGFSGFQIVAESQSNYSGFICLGAYPLQRIRNSNGPIRILCGSTEPFVENGTLHRLTNQLRGSDFEIKTLSKADHFFLLTHREKTAEILRNWGHDIFTRKNP